MDFLFLQIMTGIAKGMNIFLLTAGFTLIYGVLRCVNLAHPSLYVIAGYFAYTFATVFPVMGFWVTLIVAPLIAAAVGALVERLLFRHVYSKHHYVQLVLGWGVMLILMDLMKITWGVDTKSVPPPGLLAGSISIIGGPFPTSYVFTIIAGGVVGFILYVSMYRTRLGILLRAMAHDQEATSALGVNVNRLWTFVFLFSSWLAGIGGVVAALVTPIRLGTDVELMLICFIVAIVGGMGSVLGALVGSLIFGVTTALGILVLPRFVLIFIYAVMVIMLVFRPHGLFGRAIE